MKPKNFSQQVTIRHTLKVKYLTLFIAIGYSLALVFLSLINLNRVLKVEINASDKTLHFISYGLLFLIWSFYFYTNQKKFDLKWSILLAGALTILGIIIELLQEIFTSYRTFDWWDAVANTIGIMIGLLIFTALKKHLIK